RRSSAAPDPEPQFLSSQPYRLLLPLKAKNLHGHTGLASPGAARQADWACDDQRKQRLVPGWHLLSRGGTLLSARADVSEVEGGVPSCCSNGASEWGHLDKSRHFGTGLGQHRRCLRRLSKGSTARK